MGKIIHHTGDLFEVAPKGAVLAHACNCQGVWRSGIAKQFAEFYPEAYDAYRKYCTINQPYPGSIKLCFEERGTIACLLTSYNESDNVDPELNVLEATERSLNRLKIFIPKGRAVYSPKINSDRFKVPWEKTEEIIKRVWPGDWHVVSPK